MYFWVIVCVIVILCLAGFATIGVIRLRRKRLEKSLKLEITNQGNVDCRFQLRAEDQTGGLSFQFMQNGARLSEWAEDNGAGQEPVSTNHPSQASASALKGQPSPVTQKAQGALNVGSIFSSLLTSVGSLLPGSAGSKVMRTGTQIAQTESKAIRVQQVAGQASTLKTRVSPASTPVVARSQPAVVGPTVSWSETSAIEPGKMTVVDLKIHSGWIKQDEARPFQVKSRATGQELSPLVEDGIVQIQGGFWSHHLYPKLLIAGITIAALALVAWLASIGVLM